jgi:N,N'-diacetylchitobiose transport system substrate-binding protein
LRTSHLAAAGALSLAAALTLTACGNQPGSSVSGEKGKTLNVWLMQDTLTPQSQAAIIKQFHAETGATVKIETQQWDNINTKMTTALATDTPPDVVEIGNTDVPLFAATGALADITSDQKQLSGGGTFLTGLDAPATVGGKLYAAPFYGGARGVIYNKTTWAAAGVTAPPATFAEFTADLDKVAAKNKSVGFSPIYVSGTYWYGGFSFVADAGGSIAQEQGGKWTSGLTSPGAEKGLQQFKDFQNKYSTVASRTAALDTPDPNVIFGTGKTSAILGNGNSLASIISMYPKLDGVVGSFVMPSPNHPGAAAPTYVGGSDLGISAKSQNQALAVKFVEMMASPSVQIGQLTKLDGHIPVTQQLIAQALPSVAADQQAFFKAAEKSYATPAAPGWATIESDQTVLSLFSQVAAGTSTVSGSAASFSAHLVQALNANL